MHPASVLLLFLCLAGQAADAAAEQASGWSEISVGGRPSVWGRLEESGTVLVAMGEERDGVWPGVIRMAVRKGEAVVLGPVEASRVQQLLEDKAQREKLAAIHRQEELERERKAAEARQQELATATDAQKEAVAEIRRVATEFFTAAIAGKKAVDGSVYIGIPAKLVDELMDPQYTGRQKESQWCWAACIQMIARYNNVNYPQEDVVKAAKGALINQGGSIKDFILALTKEGVQDNGQPIQLQPKFTNRFIDMLHDLEFNHPMIACLMPPEGKVGHAVVLTGVRIPVGGDGKPKIDDITFIVRDPSPQAPSQAKIPLGAFSAMFAYAVRLRVTMW